MGEQAIDGRLDHVDAGGFQRLDKTARQADGDDVFVPQSFTPAGAKLDNARIGQGFAGRQLQQNLLGSGFGNMVVGKDVAVADALLDGDAPLPPAFGRRRHGEGLDRPGVTAGHDAGAVHRQPAIPLNIVDTAGAFDE